jgi:uroporphyrinogen decarboxylase
VGVDWTTDLGSARLAVQDRVALQGNLDPSALFAPKDTLQAAARAVLDSFGKGPGHIFNLGHGITPGVDPDRVGILVETVRDYVLAPPD